MGRTKEKFITPIDPPGVVTNGFPVKNYIQVSAIEVFLSLIRWAVMFRILTDRFRFRPVPVPTGSGSNRSLVNRTRFLVPGSVSRVS